MAFGKSVQFTSVDAVCDAYQMRCVPAFSVFQGTQLLFKYEGKDMDEGEVQMREFLKLLSQSAAIYTLCVYEDLGKQKISNKTPYQGSYNFRLQDKTAFQEISGISAVQQQLQAMNSRLDELQRERMARELEDMEDEDQEIGQTDALTSSLDKIAGILEHPIVKSLLPILTNALTKNQHTMPNELMNTEHQAAGQLSGLGDQDAAPIVVGDMEFSQQLLQAIHTIVTRFPESEQALLTLADLAERKPDKFRFILGSMKWL